MSIKSLTPYIIFNGDAEKAIQLYASALGAKIEQMSRYGDAPGATAATQNQQLVLHAVLRIGESILMISDTQPGTPAPTDGNVQISLDFAEPGSMEKPFEALSAGGKVAMPLQETFWGAKFGMLSDAYGVRWMFNCDIKKA